MAHLLDRTDTLRCPHVGGTAQLVNLATRVFIAGHPAVLAHGAPLPVTGCPLAAQPPGTTYCSAASFTSGTRRVFSDNQPLATRDSQAVFLNTGAAQTATARPSRVEAE